MKLKAGTGIRRVVASGRRAWLVGVVVLLATAAVVVPVVRYNWPSSSPSSGAGSPVHFRTLPVDARLPSGAQCARWVRASPSRESRPANKIFNHAAGQPVGPGIFPPGDSPQVRALAPRISGDFTGTTAQILRWAACKWGIDQDIVFAQAAVESWWQQSELGDWAADAARCPSGHAIGADGKHGECPQSYGILQDKYTFAKEAWPAIGASTAMNVDVAYAIWRSCYDGYEVWLNNQPRGQQYLPGDLWGCVGRWFTGDWYTPAANLYIKHVRDYLQDPVWERPGFAESG